MFRLSNYLFVSFFIFCTHVLSQEQVDYKFNHVNRSNGFPADFVYGIEQDSSGYIWAITANSLLRYNGHSGKAYSVKTDSSGFLASHPYVIYTANDGKIWIGYSDPCISSFDPVTEKFVHYFHDEANNRSFPNAQVSKFFEDSKGNFWIGTWGGGLLRFDKKSNDFTQFLPEENNPNSIQSTLVTAIQEDRDGTLLICTWEGDGYDNFLFEFDPVKNTFRKFSLDGYATENETEAGKIQAAFKIIHFIEIDDKNNFWVGTYSGLFYLNRTVKTVHRITGLDKSLLYVKGHVTFDNATSCLYENEDKLWVSTEVGGIMVVDLKTHEVTYLTKEVENPGSIGGNIIRDMLKDVYGNIFVANEGGGIDIYVPFEQQFRVISNDFLQAVRQDAAQGMFAINHFYVASDNETIVVSHGNGVTLYNTNTGEVKRIEIQEEFEALIKKNPSFKKYNYNNAKFVGWSIEIKDGYIFSTHIGFVYYDKKSGKLDFSQIIYYGRSTFDYYDGDEWHYTFRYEHSNLSQPNDNVSVKLYNFNTRSKELIAIDTLPKSIGTDEPYDYLLCEKLDSVTLCLTYSKNSIMIYNVPSKTYKVYSYLQPFSTIPDSNYVPLHIEEDGTLWLVTQNKLLTFNHRTGEFKDIKPLLNLNETDRIQTVYKDDNGIVWIALRYDLIRFNPVTNEVFRFGKNHGLDVGGFVRCLTYRQNSKNVFFRVNYGLVFFNPDKIKYNSRKPNMMLSDLVIGKDTLSTQRVNEFLKNKPLLDWDENFITFEFAADLLFTPGGKSYEYRLNGLDTIWIQAGNQNKVTYTNLKAGNYQFEARCTDAFGITSEPLIIPFAIDKPFWLKWWFILIVVLIFVLAIIIFIKWREKSLKGAKIILEKTVEFRTSQVRDQVVEIVAQKNIIELKNKELTDSILYAKRIQQTLLTSEEILKKNLPPHFVLFLPKDIVSGDFYWSAKTADSFYMAICDSTGHGVPGAFMSMMNVRYLYEAIAEKNLANPNKVFDYVRKKLIENLSKDGGHDGMDGTLVRFEKGSRTLTYASSQNRPVLIRNQQLTQLEADKMPVGSGVREDAFREFTVELQKGDTLYFFTDGYADQFGGPRGKKLKHKKLLKLLLEIHELPVAVQRENLKQLIEYWRGNLEQVDDILIMGLVIE